MNARMNKHEDRTHHAVFTDNEMGQDLVMGRHGAHQKLAYECSGAHEPLLKRQTAQTGVTLEWMSVDAALTKLNNCNPTSELGHQSRMRDAFFLETYVVSVVSKPISVTTMMKR